MTTVRKPTPRTQAIADQVLAALKAADGYPLSTREVCDRVTTLESSRHLRLWHELPEDHPCKLLSCDGTTDTYAAPLSYRVGRVVLLRLEKAGDAVRLPTEAGSVFWCYAGPRGEAAAALELLEQVWSES